MELGIDWVYSRLVKAARNGDRNQVRALATIFRLDVLSECIGMACADIDWHSSTAHKRHACEIVRDVCIELTRKGD